MLPGGLGDGAPTRNGPVVYPDRGAGFDLMAENTATGTRTVSRVPSPHGPRMVTVFVRTPAETVMLAHTNGYLTINRATPTADTVGMFLPAESRDATGTLVPSSYVVREIRPGLYQLSEVIAPGQARCGRSISIHPCTCPAPGGCRCRHSDSPTSLHRPPANRLLTHAELLGDGLRRRGQRRMLPAMGLQQPQRPLTDLRLDLLRQDRHPS